MKLQNKITLIVSIIVMMSIAFLSLFIGNNYIDAIEEKIEVNIMNTASVISKDKYVIDTLSSGIINLDLQAYINDKLDLLEEINMIVIADMNGIRYSHPKNDRIGLKFVGSDEREVIENGTLYISTASGTLGESMRAFVPIKDGDKQIGFVMAGTLTNIINKEKNKAIINVAQYTIISLFIGLIFAIALSRNIKQTLMGLEPDEIAALYVEKNSMLQAIDEGIIAIDLDRKITMINDSAKKILRIKKSRNKIIGKYILDVFPKSKLIEVLESNESHYNREQMINDTIIMTNRVPIVDDDIVIGAIATFRDKTIVAKLAEEITGVNLIVDSLRASQHEFLNKLHIILGLIRMGDIEKAANYITSVTREQQKLITLVMNNIKEPNIAGLLLGKISSAREKGIQLSIDESLKLSNDININIKNILVKVLGNLIDNAIDSYINKKEDLKIIELSIIELDRVIEIAVNDNGCGMTKETINSIFDKGFSRKENHTGIGMSMIEKSLTEIDGSIEIKSVINQGTQVHVIIPLGEKNV